MIRLVLILVLYMIPAALISKLLLFIFPHMPGMLLGILCLAAILGGYYKLHENSNRKKTEQNLPPEKLAAGRLIFLSIATIIACLGVYSLNRTELYLDNGTAHSVTIKVSHERELTLLPHEHVLLKVVKGDLEIKYDGKTKKFSIPKDGKWVLNNEPGLGLKLK